MVRSRTGWDSELNGATRDGRSRAVAAGTTGYYEAGPVTCG